MQFLEFSVPTPDVADSLHWYTSLGFSELSVGDIRNYHYAVVSDGQFCIGLHGAGIQQPALSFVRPELASYVIEQRQRGYDFDYARIGADEFNEAGCTDPDGTLAVLMEARSFSPASEPNKPPLTGLLEQLFLPCSRLQTATEFWQRYGFIVVESENAAQAELHAPGLLVKLSEGTHQPLLRFRPANMPEALARLLDARLTPRPEAGGYVLQAPEGTRLLLQAD